MKQIYKVIFHIETRYIKSGKLIKTERRRSSSASLDINTVVNEPYWKKYIDNFTANKSTMKKEIVKIENLGIYNQFK